MTDLSTPPDATPPELTPNSDAANRAANLQGAGWMTIAMAGYVINDSLIKLAAEDAPLFQAIFIRGFFITVLLTGIASSRGDLSGLRISSLKAVGPRIVFEMIATVCYLTALTHMEIANITAVVQIVPLLVTLAAARLLRERVRPYRWASVAIGFIGVMIIVRPGTDGFNAWSLLALAAVLLVVARELTTRRIDTAIPSLVVALSTAVSITVMAAVISIFQGWDPLNIRLLLLLGGASTFLAVGYVGSVITIRIGDVSFTAAFRYTVAIFAIVLQIVVFQDIPDLATWIGSAVIVGAGLFAFTRERAVNAYPSPTEPGTTLER